MAAAVDHPVVQPHKEVAAGDLALGAQHRAALGGIRGSIPRKDLRVGEVLPGLAQALEHGLDGCLVARAGGTAVATVADVLTALDLVNVKKVSTKFPHFWSYAERVRNQILVRMESIHVLRFCTYPLKPQKRSARHLQNRPSAYVGGYFCGRNCGQKCSHYSKTHRQIRLLRLGRPIKRLYPRV